MDAEQVENYAQPHQKARVGRPELGRDTDLHARAPRALFDQFRAACVASGRSLTDAINELLQAFVQERGAELDQVKPSEGIDQSAELDQVKPSEGIDQSAELDQVKPSERLDAAQLWERLAPRVAEATSPTFEAVWWPGLAPSHLSENRLFVSCRNEFWRDQMKELDIPRVIGALASEILGRAVSVLFVLAPTKPAPAPAPAPAQAPAKKRSPLESVLIEAAAAFDRLEAESSNTAHGITNHRAQLLGYYWRVRIQEADRKMGLAASPELPRKGNKRSPP